MYKKITNKIKKTIERRKEKKINTKYISESKRLQDKYPSIPSIKIHFGCGPRVLKDWVNIDLDFEPYENYLKYYKDEHYPPEIRGTRDDFYAIDIIKTGIPLPDNCVDVIFHEDFIEHLTQKQQVIFLAETFRVLKKGGIHRVNTPELLESMKNSDFTQGRKGVYVGEWDQHTHFNILTKNTLDEMARMIGYSDIKFNTKNKSTSPLIPKEYRPNPNDRPEQGNLFADLIK